ncbi:hypothetical protein BV25DRAFT_1818364 [Artomyces pyxidatus]|uniref:Uncharacterized protein n=1 Tax=Artomyces pyxidatus TaxID=48021 RepID=A0ACB8THW6_9AGAM|nr:hypothetical protein BV25DRAFT_1818364 [Artomyces pyxidatus]
MFPRGRSRTISPVALARQASEERQRTREAVASIQHYTPTYTLPRDPEKCSAPRFLRPSEPSTSPSPVTTPLALTPPDPAPLHTRRPRTLRVDDVHAPIDPRVPPPSSSFSTPPSTPPTAKPKFLPPQPEASTSTAEADARARRAKQRYAALSRAESAFAAVLARTRHERIAVLLSRARAEEERKDRERARVSAPRQLYTARGAPTYRVLAKPQPQPQEPDRFTYAFPVAPSHSQRQGSPRTRVALAALTDPHAVNTRAVPFKDVRASLHGALFPEIPRDAVRDKSGKEAELLGVLLEAVRWQAEERWLAKGKAPERHIIREDTQECEACIVEFASSFSSSASSSVTASASTSYVSRPTSWLSFASSRKSSSALSTAQTTPASTHKQSSPLAAALHSLTLQSAQTTPHATPVHRHSCNRARAQCFVAVDLDDSPLGAGASNSPTSTYTQPLVTGVARSQTSPQKGAWRAVLAVAAHIQHAYVSATLASLNSSDYASPERSPSPSPPPNPLRGVAKADVAQFLGAREISHTPYAVLELREVVADAPPAPVKTAASFPFVGPEAPGMARPRPVENSRYLMSRALANSRRARGAAGQGQAVVQMFYAPERVLGVGWDVHQGQRSSALRWGWRVACGDGDAW